MRREIAKLYHVIASQRVGAKRRPMTGSAKQSMRPLCREMDCFASLAVAWRVSCHTGSAIEYFTWLSAKLDSIEAIPSSRVSLFFRNAS
ncbi:hypothetical protein V1286_004511 [Bradyrhizobium algeriense]|uniref:Transposase n=1 Tax=Bradyrhizobium algeriense TaxID=634784 RepID=A0ABU8BEL1_9BRAD